MVLGQLSPKKIALPNPKTNPNPNPNRGQFSTGAIVRMPLNKNTHFLRTLFCCIFAKIMLLT